MKIGVVLVCAGRGERLKAKQDKSFVLLNGKPLFWYSLNIFIKSSIIREIAFVVSKRSLSLARKALKNKKITVVEGGRRRQDSVYKGIRELSPKIDTVLIHDGARPFISKQQISALVRALKKYPAVTPGVPVKEALKKVQRTMIVSPVDRKEICIIQTPQGFRRSLIEEAFKKFKKKNVYDESEMIGLLGQKTHVVPGDYKNIKITYPQDLDTARALARYGKCS